MFQIPNKVEGNTYNTEEFNKGVREELQTFITDTSQSFNPNDPTQMVQAVNRIAFNRTTLKEAVGSSGAAYQLETVVANVQALKVLENGSIFYFKAIHANTTKTPTIIINTLDPLLTPIPLKRQDGSDLYIGQIKVGDIVSVHYNATAGRAEVFQDNDPINELRNVNEGNFHNVISFNPVGNVYTLQSPVGISGAYQGYLIRFKATNTITGAAHITIPSTAYTDIPLEKDNRQLVAGDITAGDVIEAVTSGDGTFQIVKQTFQTWLNTDNQLVSKDLNGDNVPVYNFEPLEVITGTGTRTLTEADNKKQFMVSSFSGTQTIILPSKTAPYAKQFECYFALFEPFGGVITFEAPAGESFLRDGLGKSSYTLRINYGGFSGLTGSNLHFKIHYVDASNGFILTGADGATTDVQGVGRIATNPEALAGTNETAWITPASLHYALNNLGYFNFEQANPVGTIRSFGNDFDPNTTAPFNTGSMVWTPITEGYVPQTTTTPGQAGQYAGANSFQGGSTNGHTLVIGEIPDHVHSINNVARPVQEGSADIPIIGPPPPTASNMNTGSAGGNQAHSHVYNGKVHYRRDWQRTA